MLEEERVGHLRRAHVVGEGIHQDGRAEEPGLEAVAMVLEVLEEGGLRLRDRVWLLEESELEREERRSLHVAEDGQQHAVLGVHELRAEEGERPAGHGAVRGRVVLLANGLGHRGHHARVPQPVAASEVLPVLQGVRLHAALAVWTLFPRGAAAGLELLVGKPVGPLVARRLRRGVLHVLKERHVALHRIPALLHHARVAELLPHRVRHDDAGVRPAELVAALAAVLRQGRDARVRAVVVLRVAHVAHPLQEEAVDVGVVGGCLREHLRVGRPAQALVALRTVRRYGKVVGVLAPFDVGDELVDVLYARLEASGLAPLRDGGDGDGAELLDRHLARRRDGHVAVAEEGEVRAVRLVARAREGVVERRARLAVVGKVGGTFGAVASALLRAIAVVEHFGGPHRERDALGGGECEARDGGRVLREVHHKRLALVHDDVVTVLVAAELLHLAELAVLRALEVLPNVHLGGGEGKVATQADGRAAHREELALEFGVDLRGAELVAGLALHPAGLDARVVVFAVEDRRAEHGAGGGGEPRGVRSDLLFSAVRVAQDQLRAEGGLLAEEIDDLVAPPAGGDLGGERVGVGLAGLHKVRHVVGE